MASDERPNIVLVLADDMGYSDLGCFGSEIRTPTLDALAAHGVRFTQFYNTARCCPTRAALLTGLWSHEAGIGHMMEDRGHGGYRGDLNERCLTLAQVLGTAGYGTYMAGKWHVTPVHSENPPKQNWPLQRGFDRFYGTIMGGGSFFDPATLVYGNEYVSPEGDPYYYTDAITDHAVRFVREHDPAGGSPFFLYVAYTAPHWPMHALPEDIERYRGRYAEGWDALREERLERMRALGIVDERWGITERDPEVPPWDEAEDHPWFERRMEVYAAMIDRMDQGIGRIVQALRDRGAFENTLFVFLSDNGGCAEEQGSQGEPVPSGEALEERRPRTPGELRWDLVPKFTRDGRPVRRGRGVMPGPDDTYVAYGRPWANVSNTPFRLYKHWVHEGGIATPFIAHWPRGLANAGSLQSTPGHVVDLAATFYELAGAHYPERHRGRFVEPLAGASLLPVLQGGYLRERPLFWEHEGNRAVRLGPWKLVAKGKRGAWELYDLRVDRTERDDLAALQPDRVEDLARRWQRWAEHSHVLPLDPRREERFSERTTFRLRGDARLARERAPHLTGRSVEVVARFEHAGEDGVIVAQGGSSLGVALYVQDGRLAWAIRRSGMLATFVDEEPLPLGFHTVRVVYPAEGHVRLHLDDVLHAEGESPGALDGMPIDGLEVGCDEAGAVGPYPAPFAYGGAIRSVVVRLR
ncbi:MAG: sulfatase-like hydrolase/transferase [Planctomycetes bacterium]|nr:sulfatase-like hydrolase/transferase [Planctomycetota bacterium]